MSRNNDNYDELSSQLQAGVNKLYSLVRPKDRLCIVTYYELNEQHGTGIFIRRICPRPESLNTVRSASFYHGVGNIATVDLLLDPSHMSKFEAFARLDAAFRGNRPTQILAIPYHQKDVLNALAVKELYDVPLCTFIMDDQNIYVKNITDESLAMLIRQSDICFGISPELCQVYGQKFNSKFWWFPPVVSQEQVISCSFNEANFIDQKEGVLIGNIWSSGWLEKLRQTIKTTNIKINWYGKPNRKWVPFEDAELEADGINYRGFLDEEQLIQTLQQAPFSLILTGDDNQTINRPELTYLSLPSRTIFILATAQTPIIVMGTTESAVARFVERFDIGLVCDYNSDSFAKAVHCICQPENQRKFRLQAARLATYFSDKGIEKWMMASIKVGRALDSRFERLIHPSDIILNSSITNIDANQILPTLNRDQATVIVTVDEITPKHGGGALVKRIFDGTENVISIRSFNHYDGDNNFGDENILLCQKDSSRIQVYLNVIQTLQACTLRRIFCIPYDKSEIYTAIAIKDVFNIPMGSYIMDDRNIVVNATPDDLMYEYLSKCRIRFTTHPEIRDAYQSKYKMKFWLLPAIVPHQLINNSVTEPEENHLKANHGVLVGSIWSGHWFEMLKSAIKGAGVQVDWFGNNRYYWLTESLEHLSQQGIHSYGVWKEQDLAQRLKLYPYAIVPTGTLDERDDRQELSRLSLPGRILFIMATAGVPVIIVGSADTGAAHFVKHFKIGTVCDYDGEALKEAVTYVTQLQVQKSIRERSLSLGPRFSDIGIRDWTWESLEKGKPVSDRFESLFDY